MGCDCDGPDHRSRRAVPIALNTSCHRIDEGSLFHRSVFRRHPTCWSSERCCGESRRGQHPRRARAGTGPDRRRSHWAPNIASRSRDIPAPGHATNPAPDRRGRASGDAGIEDPAAAALFEYQGGRSLKRISVDLTSNDRPAGFLREIPPRTKDQSKVAG